MSRGPGAVQRAVLQLLWAERSELRPELWLMVKEVRIGEVTHESIRRAVQGLNKLGLVDTLVKRTPVAWTGSSRPDALGHPRITLSTTYRPVLFTRIALTPNEAAEAVELRIEFERHQEFDPRYRIQGAALSPEQHAAIAWCDWYRRPEIPPWPAQLKYNLDYGSSWR